MRIDWSKENFIHLLPHFFLMNMTASIISLFQVMFKDEKKKKKRKKKLLKTIRTDLIRTYIIWDKMKNILQGETLEENISRKLLLAVWLSLWLLSHIKRIVQHIKMCGNRNFCFNAHICMHTNMYCLNI